MKGSYGRIRLSQEFLDDIYKSRLTHVVFSTINILECTQVWDLPNSGELSTHDREKYIEYFCESSNFDIIESYDMKNDAPFYCCKMTVDTEEYTNTLFKKNIKVNWVQIDLEDDNE